MLLIRRRIIAKGEDAKGRPNEYAHISAILLSRTLPPRRPITADFADTYRSDKVVGPFDPKNPPGLVRSVSA